MPNLPYAIYEDLKTMSDTGRIDQPHINEIKQQFPEMDDCNLRAYAYDSHVNEQGQNFIKLVWSAPMPKELERPIDYTSVYIRPPSEKLVRKRNEYSESHLTPRLKNLKPEIILTLNGKDFRVPVRHDAAMSGSFN